MREAVAVTPNRPDRLDRLDEFLRDVEAAVEESTGYVSVPLISEYMDHVRERLEAGAREYGDRSFTRPPGEILDELAEEAADLTGWAYPLAVIAEALGNNALRDAAIAIAVKGVEAAIEIEVSR